MPEHLVTLRAGRLQRIVIGAATPPAVEFFAPDAPQFESAPAIANVDGDRYTLDDIVITAHPSPFRVDVDVSPGAEIFGFGAATGEPTRNGQKFRIMTLDTLFFGIEGSSYTAFPFFIVKDRGKVFGVLVATTYPLDAECSPGRVKLRAVCETANEPVDIIIFRGSAKDIVQDLASLVGKTFLPPLWALGFHQSRWSYKTQDVVLDVARRFRKENLPADVIHLDIHYMDNYKVFTFSPERFPEPKKMHEKLSELGFRTMAIVDPGVSVAEGYRVYEDGRARGMFMKKKDGSLYEGKVWPGATVFPDFTRADVREFWAEQHQLLLDAGVAGFWNDMNDPVFKVAKVYDPLLEDICHAEHTHAKMRNVYANQMAMATRQGMDKFRPGKRHMILSRSGFLGVQRFSAIWTGDNHSSWDQLKENLHHVVSLGISGVPIAGADIGGFGGRRGVLGAFKMRPPSELFVRWMELGSVMPFMRVHSTLYSPRQEPWSFGKEALDLSRKWLRRRYRLLPLLYRLFLEAHETGLPVIRPMWMHYERTALDQFLVGDALLVAPILDKGKRAREVVLPEGSWVDYETGVVHKGGTTIRVEAPLGTMPMFIRAGAPLFGFAACEKSSDEALRGPLTLEVHGAGSASLFLDDGDNADGKKFLLDATVEDLGGKLAIRFNVRDNSFTPPQKEIELRVPRAFAKAVVDGKRIELPAKDLMSEDRRFVMSAAKVPLDAKEIVVE
jgi:alpha-glucosidase